VTAYIIIKRYGNFIEQTTGNRLRVRYCYVDGQSEGIVEVIYKAQNKDVPLVLRKANAFRANFTKYKSHKIYLGLATMAFYPELEKVCKDNGIDIIKQSGDTVVINDKHLKAI